MSAGAALAVALCVLAGLAGAVQVAVMGELGTRVGIASAVAFSGVVTVVLAVAGLLVLTRGLGGLVDVVREPVWLWTGGALSVFIIVTMTVAGPRIGVAATIGIVIAGNLVMAAVVDRFGLFGLDRIPLTPPRVLGLALLAAGAALSLHRG
ncbi:MAG: DMT family transporter [Thermoleophilia bacterium]|nr:DMT family transporter [Thermoleophilia bacterium]